VRTWRLLALLVVLALGFALLSATASSARHAGVSSSGMGVADYIALRDDGGESGGDDDRWGDLEPPDPDPDTPEPGGDGGDEEEGEEGEAAGLGFSGKSSFSRWYLSWSYLKSFWNLFVAI
jgi:hypothetical protein